MATNNDGEKKMKMNGVSSLTENIGATTNGDVIEESTCDNNKNILSKMSLKLLLISSSSVILICALLIGYHQNNLFHLQRTNDDDRTTISTTTIKIRTKQQNSQMKSATKKSIQNNHADDYDPDSMIKFIDNILNSTLDDFVTIENNTVNLTELSRFNNNHFAPRILSLVKLEPFKFVKFNLKRPCLLWPDTFSCTKMYVWFLLFLKKFIFSHSFSHI